MESTVTVTEAVRGFSGLIDRVVHRGEVAILTRNGKPVARITPERVRRTTGRELAEFWRNRIPMSLGEADSFAKDLAEIRSSGNRPQRDPWME
jgi:prevent-host-death family protein